MNKYSDVVMLLVPLKINQFVIIFGQIAEVSNIIGTIKHVTDTRIQHNRNIWTSMLYSTRQIAI